MLTPLSHLFLVLLGKFLFSLQVLVIFSPWIQLFLLLQPICAFALLSWCLWFLLLLLLACSRALWHKAWGQQTSMLPLAHVCGQAAWSLKRKLALELAPLSGSGKVNDLKKNGQEKPFPFALGSSPQWLSFPLWWGKGLRWSWQENETFWGATLHPHML